MHDGRTEGELEGWATGPDCTSALQELYRFLDGELTVHRKVVIRTHLEHCVDCLEAFEFEAELKVVVSSRCRADHVPEELRARIAGALLRAREDSHGT